ncbi:hypothetical protein [Nostoc sp.]|uniref:hypothetical protein n=1 Tax=Nostoc sp. TaxID=1180 RepID=UPI002FF128A9
MSLSILVPVVLYLSFFILTCDLRPPTCDLRLQPSYPIAPTTQNKKPLSFIRYKIRLIPLSPRHYTFTNMRSLWVHVGNGIETIALPINFACLWYRI